MGGSSYHCSNESLVFDLLTYNEVEAAKKLKSSPKEVYEEIKSRVIDIACEPQHRRKDGSGMLLCKAAAIAAIEVLEGQRRELNLKRRDFASARRLYRGLRTPTEKAVSLAVKLILIGAVAAIAYYLRF